MPPPRTAEVGQWTAEMIAYCELRGIPVLDLEPSFEEARRNSLRTYYRIEGHWNAAGHAVTAHALHDFLVTSCFAAD
jgi:hypothetical protein